MKVNIRKTVVKVDMELRDLTKPRSSPQAQVALENLTNWTREAWTETLQEAKRIPLEQECN